MHKSYIVDRRFDQSFGEDQKILSEFEAYRNKKKGIYNQNGTESKINRRKSMTKIVWGFKKEAAAIIKNLLE